MALAAVTLLAAIGVAYLRGGRLARISQAGLRWNGLLFVGFGFQVLLDVLADRGLADGATGYAFLLASHLLVLAWVTANWWRPGMVLILVGFAMNAAVIAANGAMPVDPEAIRALGIGEVSAPAGKHVLMGPDTRLAVLGDIIPLPVLRTIVSWGDIVLAAGLLPLLHHLMTYRTPVERRGGARTARRDAQAWERTSATPSRS
ncbi:MAG: DUF5317 domain-containing protein [Nitriliruptorales bacterium]|nr:DUF5317 domain-containing protein [Nitriliruptorales bacterium]